MIARPDYDAVVIGSGPNGLVAAVELATAGHRVVVFEAAATPGGGARTAALTRPGYRHDVCSAIHPLGVASPALRTLPLERHGVRWIHPDMPLAHPLPDGPAALLHRSLDETVAGLGVDGPAWRRLMDPFGAVGDVGDAGDAASDVHRLGLVDALLSPLSVPRHPVRLARFGVTGIRSASGLARARFQGEAARGLLGGLAAHSVLPLDRPITAGLGIMLGALGHLVGWPMAEGGSQAITDALVSLLREHGGEVVCDQRIDDLGALPGSRVVLADVAPRQLLAIAGDRLPARYRRRLGRFRYGPAVFKVDYALREPVPWADPAVAGAGTVHLGGILAEVEASEAAMFAGRHAERPFVLVAQQSLFDPTRAPAGCHTLWAYCHVPNGSTVDMTAAIEAQLERAAPGFRDIVVDRHASGPAQIERTNANYVGGDISAGTIDLRQFVARPVLSRHPWKTPIDGLYLCSASTPPGGGVHGMGGHHAARLALAELARR